ncbi:MAG: hypothetical protein HYZ57_02285 [Acidobacteria bacterium]|nr:hypothetical protein [Acidobacteriota bacterium]
MRLALLGCFLVTYAIAAGRLPLWRDPGQIEGLDLAAGPGGLENAPHPPFAFIEEEKRGRWPKVVVVDSRRKKWMVKFGEEAKAETFASRLAWAAGYPVRPSYFVAEGQITAASSLKRAASHIDTAGRFHDARFQLFDTEEMRQIPGESFDLRSKQMDRRELNGLRLVLLIVANWDLKRSNTGALEIDGKRYAVVTDWGASLGDPAGSVRSARKWNCEAYKARTESLLEGVDNGYLSFNYQQYASRHLNEISEGIRVEDARWILNRLSKLSDAQLLAGLQASGATVPEGQCFTAAIRRRLQLLSAAVTDGGTITRTTTTIIQQPIATTRQK